MQDENQRHSADLTAFQLSSVSFHHFGDIKQIQ